MAAPHAHCPAVTYSTRQAVSLQQAVEQAPTLAELSRQASQASQRLRIIRPLLPPSLRPLVQSGAPQADGWGLLVPHNAAAAKLRQLTPALMAALASAGLPVAAIRIKVQRPGA